VRRPPETCTQVQSRIARRERCALAFKAHNYPVLSRLHLATGPQAQLQAQGARTVHSWKTQLPIIRHYVNFTLLRVPGFGQNVQEPAAGDGLRLAVALRKVPGVAGNKLVRFGGHGRVDLARLELQARPAQHLHTRRAPGGET
jgi:hypothetical protein